MVNIILSFVEVHRGWTQRDIEGTCYFPHYAVGRVDVHRPVSLPWQAIRADGPHALGCMTYGDPHRGHPVWSIAEDESRRLVKQADDRVRALIPLRGAVGWARGGTHEESTRRSSTRLWPERAAGARQCSPDR